MASVKLIFHVIDSLSRGGAETLLANSIRAIPKHKHLIISLSKTNSFKEELKGVQVITIPFNNIFNLPKCIFKLRKLINYYQPDIVHSHLYWSTIISRLSVSKNTMLFSTYHSLLYLKNNKEQFSPFLLMLDRLTYNSRYHLIGVSKAVVDMLSESLGAKKNVHLIYNFADKKFYERKVQKKNYIPPFSFISIGNLRHQKNHSCLVNAFTKLNEEIFTLNIYGEGPERSSLEKLITDAGSKNICLKGNINNILDEIFLHDIFILGSKFEGFGIALLEAMASGLPCIVSDIPSFREIGGENCIYFDLRNNNSLTDILQNIFSYDLNAYAKKAQDRARFFSKEKYITSLLNIYEKAEY